MTPLATVFADESKPSIPKDQAAKPQDVSALLEPIIKQHDIPGMAALVLKGNQTIAQGVVGIRRRGGPEKITLEDRFHLGSCTKAMTATLCAMLVEEGRLSWDMTLAQAFPKLAKKMDTAYRTVTLEQLLTNRGGMPGDLLQNGFLDTLYQYDGDPVGARRHLLEKIVIHPPEAKPGSKFIYSNAGFATAGHIAETIAGKSWEELLRERIFQPLGMNSAGFGVPGRKEVLDEPRGHTEKGQPVFSGPDAENPMAIGPAGIVHCSIGDWAKFIALHLRGAEGDARLLKPETFEKLHTPPVKEPKAYAMGWAIAERDWANGVVLNHSGSNLVWFAITWIAPKRDFAVLVTCNQGGDEAEKACRDASTMLIEKFFPLKKLDK
jgi:CubicO group peptidase (beta-lactamase class C family)